MIEAQALKRRVGGGRRRRRRGVSWSDINAQKSSFLVCFGGWRWVRALTIARRDPIMYVGMGRRGYGRVRGMM